MRERLPRNALEMRHALVIARGRAWSRGFDIVARLPEWGEQRAWRAYQEMEGRT